jgi:hypothetical protein
VTAIAVIAIVIGIYSLSSKLFILVSPEGLALFQSLVDEIDEGVPVRLPITFHLTHGAFGSLVWILSGYYLIQGGNWARYLALLWGLSVVALTFVSVGFSLSFWLKTATYVMMAYLLMRSTVATHCTTTASRRAS